MSRAEPSLSDIHLRDVIDADLPALFEQQRDPAYNHMAAFTHKDPSDRNSFLAHWARIRQDSSVIIRAVTLDGHLVGSLASWVQEGEREVTYGIAKEHWGKGIATRALSAYLEIVTERPLHACAAADNVGSRRVLEKCGFKITGHGRGFANARGCEIDEVLLKLDGPV